MHINVLITFHAGTQTKGLYTCSLTLFALFYFMELSKLHSVASLDVPQ